MVEKTSPAPIRIAQIATGAIGSLALRAFIEDPRFQLVALWVHSEAKCGLDAGVLAGAASTGVAATSDLEAIIGARPECACVMTVAPDIPMICTLLAAGIDVVTVSGISWPRSLPAEQQHALSRACATGSSRFLGTGLSPGFANDVLPLALTGLSRAVDAVSIEEFADVRGYASPELIHELVGMGKPLATMRARASGAFAEALREVYEQPLRMIAAAIGRSLHDLDEQIEYAITPGGTTAAFGQIAPGTVGGVRYRLGGLVDGKVPVQLTLSWIVADDLGPGWGRKGVGADTCWHIHVAGDPVLRCRLDIGDRGSGVGPSLIATSMRAVNVIPYFLGLPPGIHSGLDLPVATGADRLDR